jgi:hypothetical protein
LPEVKKSRSSGENLPNLVTLQTGLFCYIFTTPSLGTSPSNIDTIDILKQAGLFCYIFTTPSLGTSPSNIDTIDILNYLGTWAFVANFL